MRRAAPDPETLIPRLETERLVLRGWSDGDLPVYAGLCARPEVMRFIGAGDLLEPHQAWRVMAQIVGHWVLRGHGLWVVDRPGRGMIGWCGLWSPEGWPGLEVGWGLAPEEWGQGYATEAALATVRFARDRLSARDLISCIHPENGASQRVAARLGAYRTGRAEIQGSLADIYTHPPIPPDLRF